MWRDSRDALAWRVVMHPLRVLPLLALSWSVTAVTACGSPSRDPFSEKEQATGDNTPAPPATGQFNPDKTPAPAPGPAEVNEVFGHSDNVLFRLDPKTKVVKEIGPFDGEGCSGILDIALDEASTLFAVTKTSLFTVDKTTGKCAAVAEGLYPNSLSFVPKGTVSADEEALVGYEQGDYVRIDTKTGAKTIIGELGGGLISSGDIVSVKGGKAYLTVKGATPKAAACTKTDCLVEVDPASGSLVKNWGSIEHEDVFGLSFWGGKLYGFDKSGELFEVTFGTSSITTTTIEIPNRPDSLSFWGAGSSTSAPLVPTPQ